MYKIISMPHTQFAFCLYCTFHHLVKKWRSKGDRILPVQQNRFHPSRNGKGAVTQSGWVIKLMWKAGDIKCTCSLHVVIPLLSWICLLFSCVVLDMGSVNLACRVSFWNSHSVTNHSFCISLLGSVFMVLLVYILA